MRSSLVVVGTLICALTAVQCGSGSSGGGSTATPTSPSVSAVTVSITGNLGNKSYVPNPVPVATGGRLMFRNDDSVTHQIVMDDGAVDFGALAPGATSSARAITSGRFHCSIHPSMVGSINTAVAPEPPADNGDDIY